MITSDRITLKYHNYPMGFPPYGGGQIELFLDGESYGKLGHSDSKKAIEDGFRLIAAKTKRKSEAKAEKISLHLLLDRLNRKAGQD